jgi:2-polyprenyl-6-methoxyphenol hydroxylase-like FAD-dependent oxidoreductase
VNRESRVVVVGGGIGGLTAALELKRVGFRVVVHERRPELAEVNTGFLLWAFAVRRLRSLGLGEGLAQIGEPLRRLVTKTWGGRVMTDLGLDRLNRAVGVPSYDVHRASLQALLAEAVGAESLRLDHRCVGVVSDDDRPTAKFEDGQAEEADLVLGADGVHSIVREHVAGPDFVKHDRVAIWRGVAEVGIDVVPTGDHVRLMGPAGLFGFGRLDEHTVRWYGGGLEGASETPASRKEALARRFAGWVEPLPTIIAATREEDVLYNEVQRVASLPRWTRGQVALLGDSAHATMPTLAVGGGLAIEDAAVLRECLTDSGDLVSALRAYETRRRALTTRLQRASMAFERVLALTSPLLLRVRDVGFRWSWPQRRAIERLMWGGSRP